MNVVFCFLLGLHAAAAWYTWCELFPFEFCQVSAKTSAGFEIEPNNLCSRHHDHPSCRGSFKSADYPSWYTGNAARRIADLISASKPTETPVSEPKFEFSSVACHPRNPNCRGVLESADYPSWYTGNAARRIERIIAKSKPTAFSGTPCLDVKTAVSKPHMCPEWLCGHRGSGIPIDGIFEDRNCHFLLCNRSEILIRL